VTEIEARKFYIRHREGYPETEMQDYARRGFHTLGVETAAYEWVDDIDGFSDLSPEIGISGYIGDVWRALKKLGLPTPEPMDYPVALLNYLGRRVERSTLGNVRGLVDPVFVKPVEHKVFSGFVWKGCGDPESRRRIVTVHDDTPVWISDPVEFWSEYRVFVLREEIVGVKHYKGDPFFALNRGVVEGAVGRMKGICPAAYALDFGVKRGDEHQTLLVEANDGFALGHYGLSPVLYVRMLSARWHELTSGCGTRRT